MYRRHIEGKPGGKILYYTLLHSTTLLYSISFYYTLLYYSTLFYSSLLYSMNFLVLSCLVLSCLVLSCLVLSCLVLSCLVFQLTSIDISRYCRIGMVTPSRSMPPKHNMWRIMSVHGTQEPCTITLQQCRNCTQFVNFVGSAYQKKKPTECMCPNLGRYRQRRHGGVFCCVSVGYFN